jgi:uncharacterized protein YjbI with pentapeptide repeats
MLRERWRGEDYRIAAIIESVRVGDDWTQHLCEDKNSGRRELPFLDSCPKGRLESEAAPRDLRGVSLHGVDVSGSTGLADTCLDHASFDDVQLRTASLRGCLLRNARVAANCSLVKSSAQHADFTGAIMRDVSLRGAHLSYAVINGADLRNADLRGAILANVRMSFEHPLGMISLRRRWTKLGGPEQTARFLNPKTDLAVRDAVARATAASLFQARHLLLGYLFYALTNYGRSATRLLMWVVSVWFLFGAIYRVAPLPSLLQGTRLGNILVDAAPEFVRTNGDVAVFPTNFAPFYFSAITLTTVGYGDITPAPGSSSAQVLVVCEALSGFVFLGAFVSLLVQNMIPPNE